MPDAVLITPAPLLAHGQGHRRLTRRVLAAFPTGDAFAMVSIGGVRPFAERATELLNLAAPILRGIATGTGESRGLETPATREAALALWDADTAEIDRLWPTVPPARFQEAMTAFGQWEGLGHWQLLYAVDNEIHHPQTPFAEPLRLPHAPRSEAVASADLGAHVVLPARQNPAGPLRV